MQDVRDEDDHEDRAAVRTGGDVVPRSDELSSDDSAEESTAMRLVHRVLDAGVDGIGPLQGAAAFADAHAVPGRSTEEAVAALVKTHVRLAAASGFVTGLGGLLTLPVTLPADVTAFYVLAARCAAGVAHLRGHDLKSPEVRSVVLVSLIGASGAAVLAEAGVKIGNRTALAALERLPGKVLIRINQKVGFRLLTKFGETGAIRLVKIVPFAGGVVGAASNGAAMQGIAKYAKSNFVLLATQG